MGHLSAHPPLLFSIALLGFNPACSGVFSQLPTAYIPTSPMLWWPSPDIQHFVFALRTQAVVHTFGRGMIGPEHKRLQDVNLAFLPADRPWLADEGLNGI